MKVFDKTTNKTYNIPINYDGTCTSYKHFGFTTNKVESITIREFVNVLKHVDGNGHFYVQRGGEKALYIDDAIVEGTQPQLTVKQLVAGGTTKKRVTVTISLDVDAYNDEYAKEKAIKLIAEDLKYGGTPYQNFKSEDMTIAIS